ncbi:hypothetical protein IQ63_33315 [Streptomyces acidiscabies]|uniref:Uncharacterized protein n=1 Tax=Streptomyces acidiscabies TaxID=42234 RepID=A0A0L0JRV4_9ACTN|nr:hypothetical protein IQ63_33315 [Streptomyces acidiscabies]
MTTGPRGQFLAQFALDRARHGAQHVERAVRLGLVDQGDREADVHDDIRTDVRLGDAAQARLAPHPAEVDGGHAQSGVVVDLQDASRDAQAHGFLISCR